MSEILFIFVVSFKCFDVSECALMTQISLKERLITYPESEVLEKLKSTGIVGNGLTSIRFIVPFVWVMVYLKVWAVVYYFVDRHFQTLVTN